MIDTVPMHQAKSLCKPYNRLCFLPLLSIGTKCPLDMINQIDVWATVGVGQSMVRGMIC